ncbi:hypothetical protein LCGC14_2431590, partial [marine sediment metagenome]
PQIGLGMTDEDIVVRATTLMGPNAKIYRRGNMWITKVNGAYAIQWMMTLYTLLGKRRREAVTEVIKFWRGYSYARMANGMHAMAKCHPDKILEAHGLCSSCYQKERYAKKQLLRLVG